MQHAITGSSKVLQRALNNATLTRGTCLLCHTRTIANARQVQVRNASTSTDLPIPRPDIESIVQDKDYAATNIRLRKSPVPPGYTPESLVAEVVDLHGQVKSLQNEVKELRSRRNALSKVWTDKRKTDNDKAEAKTEAEIVKQRLSGKNGQQGLETMLSESEARLLALGIQLPNDSSPESPQGGYDACQIVKTTSTGSPPQEDRLPAADHVELLTKLGWLYLPSHITGSSWPYLVGGGALLEMALIQYAISQTIASGYDLILPPDVVKSEIMRRCGFNPRDAGGEAQTYFVSTSSAGSSMAPGAQEAETELALAATSEVPLAAYFMKSKFAATELPKKVVAFGHAFRAEAGARGRESRGLYRVHQFSKVELFSVTSSGEGQSAQMLADMTALQWKILSQLQLPLRMMNMSTEELGAAAFQKFDIEAWMPGRGSWGELASASNCTAYQARRLDIKHAFPSVVDAAHEKTAKSNKTAYCHTLNATAVAVPRVIVALVENGAQFDAHGQWVGLTLPKVLKPFWLGKEAHSEKSLLALPDTLNNGSKATIELSWS